MRLSPPTSKLAASAGNFQNVIEIAFCYEGSQSVVQLGTVCTLPPVFRQSLGGNSWGFKHSSGSRLKLRFGQMSNSIRVLVVDDDERQRSVFAEVIASFGYMVMQAADGHEALDAHTAQPADIILADLVMPRMDGFELLRNLDARGDRTPTIVLTAFGNIEKAISVVHDLKAFWFLEKPVQPEVLRVLIERAAAQSRLTTQTRLLSRQLSYYGVLGELVGVSRQMQEVFSLISQVAPTSASVLITGESGTGKELAARALHRLSPRASSAFVAINCAAMTETLIESELFGHEKGAYTGAVERHAGCFEQANNGTVFLDEIADMPVSTQAKLLRVLENRTVRRLGGKADLPVDVRLITATNRVPEEAIRDKLLREDLYYRLDVFHLEMPPLRDRIEDIVPIAEAIIANLNNKHGCRVAGMHPAVVEHFQKYSWPGNVRELRNVLERAVILAGEGPILERHISMDSDTAEPRPRVVVEPEEGDVIRIRPGASMEELEEAYIDLVLQRTGNNKTKAADILGISVRTLHNRLSRVGRDKVKERIGVGAGSS